MTRSPDLKKQSDQDFTVLGKKCGFYFMHNAKSQECTEWNNPMI